MKIAYLAMQMPLPTQTFAISDVQALIADGHDVEVYCLREAHKESQALSTLYGLSHVRITHAGIGTLKRFLWHAFRSPRFTLLYVNAALGTKKLSWKHWFVTLLLFPSAIAIVEAIRKSQPDIVHAFWGHYPALVIVLLRKVVPRLPITMFLGAYDLYERYPLTSLALSQADGLFTHSEANVPLIKEHWGDDLLVNVVHRGIPIADFTILEENSRTETQLCTVSALDKAKRVDKVIDAFEEVFRSIPQATLLIIGDGPERQALEARAKSGPAADAIHFLGYLPRMDVFRHMSRSGIFLFLSEKQSDRLPNVVKEAMLAKCAAVVSDTLGIEELVPDRRYGVVLRDSEAGREAEIIIELINSPERRSFIGQNARDRVIMQFSVVSKMREYVRVWTELLQQAQLRVSGP